MNGDRIYKLQTCEILLCNETIQSLKLWNVKYPTVEYDYKYLKLLAYDTFGREALAVSSVGGSRAHNADVKHQPLNLEILEFVQGYYFYFFLRILNRFYFE